MRCQNRSISGCSTDARVNSRGYGEEEGDRWRPEMVCQAMAREVPVNRAETAPIQLTQEKQKPRIAGLSHQVPVYLALTRCC
jgi:hypothetical protein